ncbi:MAG: STY0301 family protein [Betaproteobacteria bacterium]
MNRLALAALVFALALALSMSMSVVRAAAPSPAAGVNLHCPATLSQAPVADGVPSGWLLRSVPGELALQRAAFYDGDPVGLGSLVPDATHRVGSTEISTWVFANDDSARVWIGCLYRDATAVVARQLPAGLRQCTTQTRLTAMGDPSGLISVQCR